MIARIWSGESPLWLLLLPFSWLYGLVSGAVRLSYRLGIQKSWRAPVPVVVVGQHYKLARDKEIVVVDGVRRFGNGWWLPAGPMRERASRLKSVDAVIVNGGVPREGEIPMRLHPGLAVNLKTGATRPVGELEHVVAMAGIGHPPRFFATLENCGAVPEKCVALGDHQALTRDAVRRLADSGQTLVMTEKDAVKCRAFADDRWWYLPVEARLDDPRAQSLIQQLVDLARR